MAFRFWSVAAEFSHPQARLYRLGPLSSVRPNSSIAGSDLSAYLVLHGNLGRDCITGRSVGHEILSAQRLTSRIFTLLARRDSAAAPCFSSFVVLRRHLKNHLCTSAAVVSRHRAFACGDWAPPCALLPSSKVWRVPYMLDLSTSASSRTRDQRLIHAISLAHFFHLFAVS
eukprot:5372159-Pleurochrysis_carterae.AAC.2